MGNTITGQDISFYVDRVFIGNITSIEGYTAIVYLVTEDSGSIVPFIETMPDMKVLILSLNQVN